LKNIKHFTIKTFFYGITILSITLNCYAQTISTIFGEVEENNHLTLELLNHKSLQRLKHIDQSGPLIYFSDKYPAFSRYEHSLGVYALLKRYNFSTAEQIAGLMHDTSHTAFSHLADYILQHKSKHTESYQDDIHDWFLTQMGVKDILSHHHLSLLDISPKNPSYTGLEQPFPDMNADRIEYNLHTALVFKDLTHKEIEEILAAMKYNFKKWYFVDTKQAIKFAKLSTHYTKNFWGNANNAALYAVSGALIKYAIQKNILQLNDLHFGIDLDIIKKLKDSHDQVIQQLLTIVSNIEEYYQVVDKQVCDVHISIKMRGIDPLVLQGDTLQRLSSISYDFKKNLQQTAQYANKGISLKFIGIDNHEIMPILKNL